MKKQLNYWILNNLREWKHPSIFWDMRKYIRHKDYFGYFTSYRRWEENQGHDRYMKMNFKTLRWLIYTVCQNKK